MIDLFTLSALAAGAIDRPDITCAVRSHTITVEFNEPDFHDPVLDKFAIVQGALTKGKWLIVVDTDSPEIRLSSYRAGMKRLVIDTRRQLAIGYTAGSRPVRAFPRPGLYTLVFSENLGMDLGDMIEWHCPVRIGR